ncbi:MAG TPA: arginine repressor [Elusimicrobiota bacterium]|jgi:transcriptional regulator of arginine metabolism|nr:arginine repressor [Elusimicrobiota bacterium]
MDLQTEKSPRELRRQAILDAVAHEELRTQQDIVRALKRRGVKATQVSVSRDLEEMGLGKIGGRYRAGHGESGVADPELPFRTWVRSVEAAGPHLVVVRCEVGTAQGVARALDQAQLPGTIGTVAGDDTIFIAVSSAEANGKIRAFLNDRIAG